MTPTKAAPRSEKTSQTLASLKNVAPSMVSSAARDVRYSAFSPAVRAEQCDAVC
jgi:hypothetical protein